MQVTVQKLSPVLVEVDVEVEAERVKAELDKAYQSLAKNARVRGFRPGKAPRKVLSHLFGARVAQDVAQRLVDDTFQKAVSDQKVQPVNQPSFESNKISDNQPFSYKARFEVIPEISGVQYAGFEVKRPKVEVTEQAIGDELMRLRRENSTLEPLQAARAAEKGDVVTLDFVVEIGGHTVEDAGATDFQVELGSGAVADAIEQALVGKRPGETAEATLEMPESHPHPALRGKSALFRLSLTDLKERVLPEADDEFAKDLGDFETLDDLRKSLSEQIEKRLKQEAENAVAEALVRELVRANPVDVPPSLVAQQARISEQELLAQARRQGQRGALPQEIRGQLHAEAEMKVRAGLLMAEIAKKEGVKIGDAELEEGIKELAEQTGKNPAKLRAEYREAKKREMLVGMLLENKVLDIIESKAKIEEA